MFRQVSPPLVRPLCTTYPCIRHVRMYFSRVRVSVEERTTISCECTIGNVNRELDVKTGSFFEKYRRISPPCVPTKEAFDRWNETPSFVCRTSPDSPCMSHVLSRATIFIMCTPNSLFALLPTRTNRIHSSLSSFHLFLSCPTRNNLYWRTRCRIGEFER